MDLEITTGTPVTYAGQTEQPFPHLSLYHVCVRAEEVIEYYIDVAATDEATAAEIAVRHVDGKASKEQHEHVLESQTGEVIDFRVIEEDTVTSLIREPMPSVDIETEAVVVGEANLEDLFGGF